MGIQLITTRDIPEGMVAETISALRSIGIGIEPLRVLQKGGELPSFITVMADLISWKTLLYIPATVFLSQLAKNAADDFYKNKTKIANALVDPLVKPLCVLSSYLTKLAKSSPRNPTLSIGLPLPNDFYGTTLAIAVTSEEKVTHNLAMFAVKVETIHETLTERVIKVSGQIGPVTLELLDDSSFIIIWYPDGSSQMHKIVVK